MTAVLAASKICVSFGSVRALVDVDLEVRPGQLVGLIGPNGAGKTTTLKVVSGVISPTRGRVRYDGRDLARASSTARARSGIAHVPEGRGIFYGLTVAEHLRLGYRGEKLDPAAVYEYFPALERLKDRPAGLLSGGEQQMLAVGRALARKPKLLLLDELSLGLAPLVVERLLPVVRSYAKASGCAVLLVEQHVQLATEIADRCYVLVHGDIVAHETGRRLRQDRALLVSSYIGRRVPAQAAGRGSAAEGGDGGDGL